MSMFMMSFMGTMPIGNIVAGSASNRFGAPATLAAGGIMVTTVAILVTITNERLRSLY
jgi:hypothetical protein